MAVASKVGKKINKKIIIRARIDREGDKKNRKTNKRAEARLASDAPHVCGYKKQANLLIKDFGDGGRAGSRG